MSCSVLRVRDVKLERSVEKVCKVREMLVQILPDVNRLELQVCELIGVSGSSDTNVALPSSLFVCYEEVPSTSTPV